MSRGYHRFYDVVSADQKPSHTTADLSGLVTPKERESEIVRIMTL
jgi:hypothetical protein